MSFFIVVAALSTSTESEVSFSKANTAREAHDLAAKEFRRRRGLPSSATVHTRTAHRGDDEAEAAYIFARLGESTGMTEPPGSGGSGETSGGGGEG